MSIEDSQNLFFAMFHHIFFSKRSGPGPVGPVRKILVVRSSPEGPQFARSVGTLVRTNLTVEWMDGQWSTKVLWFNVFISHSTQYHEDANRSSFYIKTFFILKHRKEKLDIFKKWRIKVCLTQKFTSTLDSGINVGPTLINFGFFPGPTAFY